jgi:hypothetical protein
MGPVVSGILRDVSKRRFEIKFYNFSDSSFFKVTPYDEENVRV